MREIWADLKGSKTFWLCLAVVLTSLEELLRGAVSVREGALAAVVGLVGITMRHAIEKAGEAPPNAPPPSGQGTKIVGMLLVLVLFSGCSNFEDRSVEVVKMGRALLRHPSPGDPDWDQRRVLFMENADAIVIEKEGAK